MKQNGSIITAMAMLLAILALSNFSSNGQTSVHNTVLFNTLTPRCEYAIGSGIITPMANDNTKRTIELWYKVDTLDPDPLRNHYLIYHGSNVLGKTYYALFLTDSTLTATWADKSISTHVPFDTMWHHIAFVIQPHLYSTTTLSYYDSTTLYLDGTYKTGSVLVFDHSILRDAAHNMSVGYTYNGPPYKFIGNLAKITLYDSALYSTSFIPDCIYDTTAFYDTTVTYPCTMLLPLNGNTNIYYSSGTGMMPSLILPLVYTLVYSYNVSPCAPTYVFYCPVNDTIYCSGADTVLKAVNTNTSYMKGSHIAKHKNGWLDPSSAAADFTVGVFTDTLVVSSPDVYPYISSYNVDTEKVVVVIHDTTGASTSVSLISENSVSKIYPNPTCSLITVQSGEILSRIEIINIWGQIVHSESYNGNKAIINFGQFPKGVYTIKINANQVYKAMKE